MLKVLGLICRPYTLNYFRAVISSFRVSGLTFLSSGNLTAVGTHMRTARTTLLRRSLNPRHAYMLPNIKVNPKP